MDFYAFHLMPWPHLPPDFEQRHDSAWIWPPTALYDPARGEGLYNRYLDELEYAETLGFDGVCVNEHHQNAYGNMPSPNLMAAALARRTKRVKLAVVGNALPLYDPPLRVAEEWAMLDVLSGGRLICGMVIGGGPEYYSYGKNPTHARAMFYEAHDLIMQAWTQPGPTEFRGKFWQLRYVNPWPRPLQKPHPPIWIPGAGSLETLEYVARKRYAYMGIPYFHLDVFARNFDLFREACHKQGYTASPSQLGYLAPIYVAETDAAARAEYEPHVTYFVQKLLKGLLITPPGYTSPRSMLKILDAVKKKQFMASCESWDDLEKGDFIVAGSPATVRDKLFRILDRLGAGNLLALLQLGTLGAELTRKNMDLFAREVMPALRARYGSAL
ncbi:MAG: LLM class flavin-dependent oxidoreductase [Deltaproteobacteria bacterium]|nr:LLM class flavin-dependent oxidoreductase [Deltaproteobacteria bacterium]